MKDPVETDKFGRPKRIKVNPSYLYEGAYSSGKSMPKMKAIAIVLVVAAAAMFLFGGLGEDIFCGALGTIFLVAAICFLVAARY